MFGSMMKTWFDSQKPLVGMVHLPALPGTVNYDGRSMDQIYSEAVADARVLQEAGFDGLIVQNTHDVPSLIEPGHDTAAFLSAAASEVKRAVQLPFGINAHKRGTLSALGAAAAVGAAFVRIKVYIGAVLGPEGVVEGSAPVALQERKRLGIETCQIWADVFDITSVPLQPQEIGEAAHWAIKFGAADALVVTGHSPSETLNLIEQVRAVHPEAHILAGGGVSHSNIDAILAVADGAIVGSALEARPFTGPVSLEKAKAFVHAARGG